MHLLNRSSNCISPSTKAVLPTCLIFAASCLQAQGDYYLHNIFDNSIASDNYFYSEGIAVSPSTLESIAGRLPVETHFFMSPPNALRVTWRSMPGGSWGAEIRVVDLRNRIIDFDGDTLYFWLYSPESITGENLPRIQIEDTRRSFSVSLEIGHYTQEVAAGKWTQVAIPLRDFGTESLHTFDPHRTHNIYFVQNAADAVEHTLIVDEVKIDGSERTATSGPSSLPAPTNVSATAYERHVDIKWDPIDNDDLQSYMVYRSTNGRSFEPIGVQIKGISRYVDFLGSPNKTATYKVAAVDRNYRQSALSTGTAPTTTHNMSDDDLLTMLQEACFR